MTVIALGLRSPSARTKSLIFEIFGAVCMLPGGHNQVLTALDALCEASGYRSRMEIAVWSLWWSCRYAFSSVERPESILTADKELQVAALCFINAVVCGGPGNDGNIKELLLSKNINLLLSQNIHVVVFRMHMRWEFLRLGLDTLIEKIGRILFMFDHFLLIWFLGSFIRIYR